MSFVFLKKLLLLLRLTINKHSQIKKTQVFVNHCFRSTKRSRSIQTLEMKLTCFKSNLSRASIWVNSRGDWSSGTWCTTCRRKHEPGGFWTRRFDGKMAVYGGFFWSVPQKITFFSPGVNKTLLQDKSDTNHAIFQLDIFPKNLQGVTMWLLNHYFRKKWREILILTEVLWQISV